MSRKFFGTDGVRGKANVHPITSEVALNLGRAIAFIFQKNDKRKHAIVVGKDTRISGYMIETAIASGIASMGADVLLVGPLPTPGIAFLTQGMRADAGVVISASHNVYSDNGIKFFDRDGFKLPDALEVQMEEFMSQHSEGNQRPLGDALGKAYRIDDAAGRYIEFLKNTFPKNLRLDGLKVLIDCANGAGYKVGPSVLSELGAKVIAVGVKPDGTNINDGCGALHPEAMARMVKEYKADLGIALDGDGDRVILADAKGNLLDGDNVLAICAEHLFGKGHLAHNTVVGTIMSNMGLEMHLKSKGIKLIRTDVGDRYVVEAMREGSYNLGGEPSGHVIFLHHSTTGDGMLAALRILSVMCQRGKTMEELRNTYTPYPQVNKAIKVREKKALHLIPELVSMITGYEKELGLKGRLLVRYSGTEPKARIMVEGENVALVNRIADDLSGAIDKYLGMNT